MRHPVGRALRLVVILDRGGNAWRLALHFGIATAHQTLHFGEFADHFGDQIGLAQLRRTFGLGTIGTDHGGQCGSQCRDPVDALALRAQLFMKHDIERAQFGQTLVE